MSLPWYFDNPYCHNEDDNTDENGLETMPFEIVERNRKDVSMYYKFFRQRLCDLIKNVPLERKQKTKNMINMFLFSFDFWTGLRDSRIWSIKMGLHRWNQKCWWGSIWKLAWKVNMSVSFSPHPTTNESYHFWAVLLHKWLL